MQDGPVANFDTAYKTLFKHLESRWNDLKLLYTTCLGLLLQLGKLREFWLKMTTSRFHKSKITVVANIDKQDPWMKGHQIRDWNLQRSKIVTIFSRSIRTVQFLPFPWSKKMAIRASEVKPKLRCQVPPHELFFPLLFSFYVSCTRQVPSNLNEQPHTRILAYIR